MFVISNNHSDNVTHTVTEHNLYTQSLVVITKKKYRDSLRDLTYSGVDVNLPDISTTLSDAANGNFSFSIFVIRTSPSVCVDIYLCM